MEEMHGWYRLGYKLSWLLARLLFSFRVIRAREDPTPAAGASWP